jgi:Uma2 family endonuclease
MAILITDHRLGDRLKAERQEAGADRYDEVWDGVYVVPPMPNDEHQELVMGVGSVFHIAVFWAGHGEVRPGVNVSDREAGWEHSYRIPDVAVFLRGGRARNCGTHWCGGPDFLVEVLSPGDRTRDKFPFYAAVGVLEVLVIDRDPWALELYRLQDGAMRLVGRSTLEQPVVLSSAVLPLDFGLIAGDARPAIEIRHRDGLQRWVV